MNDVFINLTFVFSKDNEGYQDKWFMTRFENEEWGINPSKNKLAFLKPISGALVFKPVRYRISN
ncbi:MAG: hypothetical protein IT221_16535 [Fluviicola sp.]|nr:hypothetical protein [Fluviicola sp.]